VTCPEGECHGATVCSAGGLRYAGSYASTRAHGVAVGATGTTIYPRGTNGPSQRHGALVILSHPRRTIGVRLHDTAHVVRRGRSHELAVTSAGPPNGDEDVLLDRF